MKKLMFLMLALMVASMAMAKAPLEKPVVPFQGTVRATEVEPNDTCETATALFVGDPMDAAIGVEGDADWFEITVAADECIIFETHAGDAGDTKMWLYDGDCVTELVFNDDGGEGYYSLIEYTFDTAGTYFILITHYSTTGLGTYILTADNCEPPPPPLENDTCETAIELPVGDSAYQIDLCTANNDYFDSDLCTGYDSNGPDGVYMVELLENGSIAACIDDGDGYIDLAIYLVTDCTDVAGTCVAGDDSGNPECIDYTSVEGGIFYLIVDTYSSCGDGLTDLTVTVENPTATEGSDWGTVKALY